MFFVVERLHILLHLVFELLSLDAVALNERSHVALVAVRSNAALEESLVCRSDLFFVVLLGIQCRYKAWFVVPQVVACDLDFISKRSISLLWPLRLAEKATKHVGLVEQSVALLLSLSCVLLQKPRNSTFAVPISCSGLHSVL